jgi:acetyltransferase-like isoleucine patch superfamily enzyme
VRKGMVYFQKLLSNSGMVVNGKIRYIGFNVVFDDFNLISLGDNIVISDGSHFLTHDYSITVGLRYSGIKIDTDYKNFGKIKIGNNVFIGKKSIILPRTEIGDNVIISAGSVVKGKLVSNSIYGGNPVEYVDSLDNKVKKWKKLFYDNNFYADK